jgi:hypothetical protein
MSDHGYCPDPAQSFAPHGHVVCPFCESTIACVVYTFPPKINGVPVEIFQIPPVIESLCDGHMGVHVEEMMAFSS